MSRIVVIGASGHIGTYLVPYLVEAGHRVVAISRGKAEPYFPHAAWAQVQKRRWTAPLRKMLAPLQPAFAP